PRPFSGRPPGDGQARLKRSPPYHILHSDTREVMKASPLICYSFVTPGQGYDKRDEPRTGPWSTGRGRGPQTSFGLRRCLRCCRVWPLVRHRLIDPPGGRTAAAALCPLSRRARPCARGRTAPLYLRTDSVVGRRQARACPP